jgi:ribosomal-protein-alanine N-acetyltransferase
MTKVAEAFPTLTTRRLHLRHVEPRDASGLHACFGDPESMRYWDFPISRTVADTEKIVGWLGKTTNPYDHLAWAIADRTTDQCVGMVNYHHRDARNKRLEIGYIVAPDHQRKGFATEAIETLLAYCTHRLDAHRIEALIHPENVASRKLVERLGFRCEGGPLTDYWCVDGQFLSAMIYARVNRGR